MSHFVDNRLPHYVELTFLAADLRVAVAAAVESVRAGAVTAEQALQVIERAHVDHEARHAATWAAFESAVEQHAGGAR
ncbi:hypothetical protein [Micromonospora sp. NPDC048169]|uniref:hypothetical protein n=1 Tax=unclassified Micromonospora TaxID=2617518 RepID=UPI0033ED18C7